MTIDCACPNQRAIVPCVRATTVSVPRKPRLLPGTCHACPPPGSLPNGSGVNTFDVQSAGSGGLLGSVGERTLADLNELLGNMRCPVNTGRWISTRRGVWLLAQRCSCVPCMARVSCQVFFRSVLPHAYWFALFERRFNYPLTRFVRTAQGVTAPLLRARLMSCLQPKLFPVVPGHPVERNRFPKERLSQDMQHSELVPARPCSCSSTTESPCSGSSVASLSPKPPDSGFDGFHQPPANAERLEMHV